MELHFSRKILDMALNDCSYGMVVPAVRKHENLIRHITAAMEKSVAAFIK